VADHDTTLRIHSRPPRGTTSGGLKTTGCQKHRDRFLKGERQQVHVENSLQIIAPRPLSSIYPDAREDA